MCCGKRKFPSCGKFRAKKFNKIRQQFAPRRPSVKLPIQRPEFQNTTFPRSGRSATPRNATPNFNYWQLPAAIRVRERGASSACLQSRRRQRVPPSALLNGAPGAKHDSNQRHVFALFPLVYFSKRNRQFESNSLRQPVLDILYPNRHCQKASSLRAEKRQMSRVYGSSISVDGEVRS